jgi:hypothetical protein
MVDWLRHLAVACVTMKAYLVAVLVVAAGLFFSPGSRADDYDYDVFGQWRFVYSHAQDFPLNAAGDSSGLRWYLDHRLDVGTRQSLGDLLSVEAELQIFYGQAAGDFDHIASEFRTDTRETLRGWDLNRFDLRQLWLKWNSPWFQLRIGQMYSDWGLGMLANDGRPDPDRFGFRDQGDISERLILATRPLAMLSGWPSKIVLAIGGGLVYRDENCSLRDGDLGGEVIGSLFYREEGIDIGMYVAGRIQEDDAGTSLDATAIDIFGRIDAGPGYQGLLLAAELAILTGSTDRVVQAERPGGVDISAFGAVLRAGWHFGMLDLLPVLEIGYASGDPDPHDGTVTSFSFDPDYKVGLVLFDTVLRGITAMSAAESADPDRVGLPLPGTDMLASKGRISGAIYINPTVRIRPLPQMTLLAGFLYAWSSAPFAQSYQTFANGGVSTNPYGLINPGRNLGCELDLGVDWKQPVFGDVDLLGGFQVGWFFPGSAFDYPDGSRPGIISRFIGRLALEW